MQELSRQATAFAESLARRELKCEVLGEAVEHESLWTEFRLVFKQHLRIWQQFTTVTLAVAPDGSLAGWLVEARKARSGQQVFADADVERRARTITQIQRGLRLNGVRRVPLDDQRSVAVASFSGPAETDGYEVWVNHTTGEVIGFMPSPIGQVSPLPTNDAGAATAQELAWRQIEADVTARLGPDTAAQARDVFKLDPESALRDERQRSFWSFRLWRFFTTCNVSIDQTTKEVVGWYVEALQSDAPGGVIAEAAAVQAARPELEATEEVQGPCVTFEKAGDTEKVSVHWWHARENVNIEGDHTTVLLNAITGKPYSVWRKWRRISPELFRQPALSQAQALQIADRAINRSPTDPSGKVLRRSVIQLTADSDQPGPVHDALVWLVGYSVGGGMGFTEVSVDCRTGEVVRVTGW